MKEITVAVTGLNNTDNPGPGVPVVRGLKEAKDFKVRIIGFAYENMEPGIYMRDLIDKVYMIPYPSGGSSDFISRILEINSIENIDLIIPNFDAELYTFITNQDLLSANGIKTFLPSLAQFEERHKANLDKFGEKYNVLVPESKPVTDEKDLAFLPEGFEYPLWIKGKFYEAYAANNFHQAAGYFHKLSAKWGLPIIIQKYAKGTEVNVIALGDGEGNTIACVPMRKQYITDKGKAWAGITIKDPKLIEITHDLIRKTKWRGGMELEIIKTKNNEYYLIEINPRIPAWVYLAVGAGQNIPEALAKLALGYNVEPMTEYSAGTMFIRYSFDLIGNIADFEKINVLGEL